MYTLYPDWKPPKCHDDLEFFGAPGTPSAQGYHQCKQGCAGKPSSGVFFWKVIFLISNTEQFSW